MRPPVPLCFVLLLLFAFKKRPDLAPSSQGEGAAYTALFIRNDLAHNFVNFLYQTLVFRFMKFRLCSSLSQLPSPSSSSLSSPSVSSRPSASFPGGGVYPPQRHGGLARGGGLPPQRLGEITGGIRFLKSMRIRIKGSFL